MIFKYKTEKMNDQNNFIMFCVMRSAHAVSLDTSIGLLAYVVSALRQE